MSSDGWRTVIISTPSTLTYCGGCLAIAGDAEGRVPLSQVRTVLINTQQATMTARLISELNRENIRLIFCDEKRNPSGELCRYAGSTYTAGRLFEQIAWSPQARVDMWQSIVTAKLRNQYKLLLHLEQELPEELEGYIDGVLPGDPTNREGQAARVYFNTLFGCRFSRRTESAVNSALNYGYTILLSSFNRLLTIHGYNTALGIKHGSRENPFNLSCDLMEPFRPFVDLLAYRNIDCELNWEYKKELIAINETPILYDGMSMELQTAIEAYAIEVLKSIGEPHYAVKEMDFIE